MIYSVSYPKGRNGEGVAKEVKIQQTFSKLVHNYMYQYTGICLNSNQLKGYWASVFVCTYIHVHMQIFFGWTFLSLIFLDKVLHNVQLFPFLNLQIMWMNFLRTLYSEEKHTIPLLRHVQPEQWGKNKDQFHLLKWNQGLEKKTLWLLIDQDLMHKLL